MEVCWQEVVGSAPRNNTWKEVRGAELGRGGRHILMKLPQRSLSVSQGALELGWPFMITQN